jgi:hypothetical protein
MKRVCAAGALLCLAAVARSASLPDTAAYDAVLAARAKNGGFDYAGTTGQDRKRLAAYEANLGDAQTATLSPDECKALYINAYNVFAIQTLLDNRGKKITDVAGSFNGAKHRVGGQMLTLDEIENRLREFKDARIHFAIVCASKSCPPLAGKAYAPEGISEVLDRQGRAFVNDSSKNVLDRSHDRVALSKIFFWNRKEFERDGGGSLTKAVSRWASDPATAAWLASFSREPEVLEYDWSPNQP